MPRIPDQGGSRTRVPVAESGGTLPLRQPSGLASVGEGIAEASENIGQVERAEQQALARYQAGEEAVERARDEGRFFETTTAKLRELETNNDLSKLDEIQNYRAFLDQTEKEILGSHRGSAASRQRLAASLQTRKMSSLTAAAAAAAKARSAVLNSVTEGQLRHITADAFNNPGKRSQQLTQWDGTLSNFSASLTPEEEFDRLAAGRAEITKANIEGYIARGQVKEARAVLLDDPTVAQYLTPSEMRSYQTQFEKYDQQQNEAVRSAKEKVIAAETVAGRKLTLSERLRLAGLEPSQGRQTPSQKIAETAAALGRPLTDAETRTLLGLGGGANPSDVGGMRKEFTAQSQDFVKVRDSYARIEEVKNNPSAAGDLALIFNFMKMLDPGSTVREGEFANAQNAAGIPDRIRNMYNRAKSGERMSDNQRTDFVGQAEGLMRAQRGKQAELENQYRGIAERAGMNPADVVIDYQGSYRQGDGSRGNQEPGAGGGTPRAEYDLQGNPINKGAKGKK